MFFFVQSIAATLALTMVCVSFPQGIHAKEPPQSKSRVDLVIGATGVNRTEVTHALNDFWANSACNRPMQVGGQPIYVHARGLNAKGEKTSLLTFSVGCYVEQRASS